MPYLEEGQHVLYAYKSIPVEPCFAITTHNHICVLYVCKFAISPSFQVERSISVADFVQHLIHTQLTMLF